MRLACASASIYASEPVRSPTPCSARMRLAAMVLLSVRPNGRPPSTPCTSSTSARKWLSTRHTPHERLPACFSAA